MADEGRSRILEGASEMRYRDDIDIDHTWVIGDTHFGHDNIVGFCHRPEDHEQAIIAEWRRVVPDEDTVLHVGDLTYKSNAWFKNIIAKELTGKRKLLIRGNHDKNPRKFYEASGFKLVRPFKIALNGFLEPIVPFPTDSFAWCEVSFSHYPWSERDDGGKQPENHWRIHGHIHNNGYSRDAFVPFLKHHVNVSVEQLRYTPVNLGVLLRAVLLGVYPETTEAQLEEARERKERNRT
jgi:calcineurin-like phosphoesterase family protein